MNESPAARTIESPARVDVAFSLAGDRVPVEHGYGLFAAMCRRLGDLHGAPWLSVHPIRGAPNGDGTLRPTELALRLRVDPAQVERVLPLEGAVLDIEGHPVTVGESRVLALEPATELFARMVVLRNGIERRADFEWALHERLAVLGVSATVEVPTGPVADGRRVLRIRQQVISGYPVILRGLSAEDSLRVQALGVGGRQRFGCGVFSPASLAD